MPYVRGFLEAVDPDAHPEHPIAPGGSPPSIWPSPGHPEHPIALPPYVPAHPIIIPPDFISPGVPAHPIVIPPVIWPRPGHPAHPIVIPPDLGIWPGGHPEHPIVIPPPTSIWPGGTPTHPIVIPPDGEPQPDPKWDVKAYWTPEGGWAVAIVPSEDNPPTVPVPSSGT